MQNLNIDEERICYLVRDEEEISTPEILEHYAELDRNSVNYMLKKMRNMGLVNRRKEQEIGGSAQPTNYYSPNSRKIKKYEKENGDLFVPRYVYSDKIQELESGIEDLEQENKDQWSMIYDVRDSLNQLQEKHKEWKEYAKKFNNKVKSKINEIA